MRMNNIENTRRQRELQAVENSMITSVDLVYEEKIKRKKKVLMVEGKADCDLFTGLKENAYSSSHIETEIDYPSQRNAMIEGSSSVKFNVRLSEKIAKEGDLSKQFKVLIDKDYHYKGYPKCNDALIVTDYRDMETSIFQVRSGEFYGINKPDNAKKDSFLQSLKNAFLASITMDCLRNKYLPNALTRPWNNIDFDKLDDNPLFITNISTLLFESLPEEATPTNIAMNISEYIKENLEKLAKYILVDIERCKFSLAKEFEGKLKSDSFDRLLVGELLNCTNGHLLFGFLKLSTNLNSGYKEENYRKDSYFKQKAFANDLKKSNFGKKLIEFLFE